MSSFKAVDDGQINNLHNFQQHSRLHFIGQWKTKMKDYLANCFVEKPDWNHGPLSQQLTFIHMDLDAFFCSVQLAKPEHAHLRDKPVAIAAGHGNSDISSCNYVARKFGVRAGMYVNSAKEICPNLITLGYDFPSCEEVVKLLYRTIFESFPSAYKMAMEVYSVDEVMLATDTEELEPLMMFCHKVREELKEATQCSISCGIGPNILLSRLATSVAKPDGMYVLKKSNIPSFIASIPFSEIHGAGERTEEKVKMALLARGMLKQHRKDILPQGSRSEAKNSEDNAVGDEEEDSCIILCADVQRLSKEDLQRVLGKKAGETFFRFCRGDDSRVVIRTGDAEAESTLRSRSVSSISCCMNYAVRPQTEEDIWKIVSQLLSDVCSKLKRQAMAAGSLRLTVLERHPLQPKFPQKFMGRGKCIEVHIPIRFLHPLQAHDEEKMMKAVQDTLRPLLVLSRGDGNESEEELCARRAETLGVTDDKEAVGAIWTVTLRSVPDLLIEDIRGLTIQATQLTSIIGDLRKKSEEQRKKHFQVSSHQQLTLSDMLCKETSNPFSSISPGRDEDEVVFLKEDVTSRTEESLPCYSEKKKRRVEKECLTGNHDEVLYAKLGTMMSMKLSEDFTSMWEQICHRACQKNDYFTVRACLRMVAFKAINENVFVNASKSVPFFSVEERIRNRLKPFERFVAARLPFSLDYF